MTCKHCNGTGIIGGMCSGFCSCKTGKKAFNEAYPKEEDKKLYTETDLKNIASMTYDAVMQRNKDWDSWPGTINIVKDYIKTKAGNKL